jgi:hypothetical protein
MKHLLILSLLCLTACTKQQVTPSYTPEELTCRATAEIKADISLTKCAGGVDFTKCPKEKRDIIEAAQTKESLECLH